MVIPTHSFDIFQLNARFIAGRLFQFEENTSDIKISFLHIIPKPDYQH